VNVLPAPTPAPGGTPAPAQPIPALDATELRRHWPDILNGVKNRRKFTWFALQEAQVTDVVGSILWLTFTNPGARLRFGAREEDDVHHVVRDLLGADLIIRGRAESEPPPRAEGVLTVAPGPVVPPSAVPAAAATPAPIPTPAVPDPAVPASGGTPASTGTPAPASTPASFPTAAVPATAATPAPPPLAIVPDDIAPDDEVVSFDHIGQEAEQLVIEALGAELVREEPREEPRAKG
jgi:DNA polymerase-3 subunit gamma/tau